MWASPEMVPRRKALSYGKRLFLLRLGIEEFFQFILFTLIHLGTQSNQLVLVLLVTTAHILRFHDLLVKLPAEDTQFHMQFQEETAQGRQLFVILPGERVGNLFAGKHLKLNY